MKIYYCDGSTRGGKNQKGADNIGGWGAVCFSDELENNICACEYDTENNTTNNRQELKALLYCLNHADEFYPDEKCIIYSDSAYVVNTFNTWIHSWAANGWKNSKKQTVENLDLILDLWEFAQKEFYNVTVQKTTGHCGEVGNELADALATASMNKFSRIIEENNISIYWDELDTFESIRFDV
jgi:ribonuclease HI